MDESNKVNTHYLDDPYFDKAEDDTEHDYGRSTILATAHAVAGPKKILCGFDEVLSFTIK